MKKQWKVVIGIIALAILMFVLYKNGWLDVKNVDQFVLKLKSLGLFAFIILMLLIVLQQIFTFIPFLSLATVNVMLYGLWKGFFFSWICSLIGALVAFYLSRTLLKNWIMNKWGENTTFTKINDSLGKSGFFYVLMGRLFPIMPSNLINFGAGISKISIVSYSIATFFGNIPFVFTCSLMAYDLLHLKNEANQERFTYVSIGLMVFVMINIGVKFILERRKQKQTKERLPSKS